MRPHLVHGSPHSSHIAPTSRNSCDLSLAAGGHHRQHSQHALHSHHGQYSQHGPHGVGDQNRNHCVEDCMHHNHHVTFTTTISVTPSRKLDVSC